MTRRFRYLALSVLALLAAPFAGCGIKGDLKTPPPLWGGDRDVAAAPAADDTDSASDPNAVAPADDFDAEDDFDEEIGYGVEATDE